MAPKKAKGKQKQEEQFAKQAKATPRGIALVDPPVVNSFGGVGGGDVTGALDEGDIAPTSWMPTQEDAWGANVAHETHNWPPPQPSPTSLPPPALTAPNVVASDTASGNIPINRLSASGVGSGHEGFDSWGVNHEAIENPQTWDIHQSQASTITAAPSAITSPISKPISISAAAAALAGPQKSSSASEAARKLEAKHGIQSHHDPWPSSSHPPVPSHLAPGHRDKVPTSSAMKHAVQQQPNSIWRHSRTPSSVQAKTAEGPWGQPQGGANASWGQTKGGGGGHQQRAQPAQPQHRVVQSWETWGKAPNSLIRITPPSPESSSDDSDEWDEEEEWRAAGHQAGGAWGQPEGNSGQMGGSWGGTGGAWGQGGQGSTTWGTASPAVQHVQSDWATWGADTKRLPKSQNINAGQPAQHQPKQKAKQVQQQAGNKNTTKQQSQWQGWGTEDAWGTQEQNGKKSKKKQQQQPQGQSQSQWGSWGEEASWGNPEQPSDKRSKKQKQAVQGQWGDENTRGRSEHVDKKSKKIQQSQGEWGSWGLGDENTWGVPEHGDKKPERDQQAQGQWGSWGDDITQGASEHGNRKSKKNQDQQSQRGNWGDDDWGMAGQGVKGVKKGQDDANGPWASWGDDAGWGAIQEETEDEETEDTHQDHSTVKNVWSSNQGDNAYNMPSKTLTHAYKGTTTTLHTVIPRNSINEYANVRFLESKGAAFQPVTSAFFGTTRLARERIHWMFPPDKDERVASLLAWIQTVSYNLGAFGLHQFLQTRERGALFTNAAFRLPDSPKEPVFDWLTFDQLQASKDKTLQESVAFYDPAVQVIIFVYLPSQSGNSVAIWRRKVIVPNNVRLLLQAEINVAMAALRREKDYVVHVDEPQLRKSNQPQLKRSIQISAKKKSTTLLRKANSAHPAPPKPPKKKRKWWNIFG